MVKKTQLLIRIEDDLLDRFKKKCKAEGRKYTPVIELLISQFLVGKVKL
jgi:predicted DNA binding CopG/RHH family protein